MPDNITQSSPVTKEQGHKYFFNKEGKRCRLPVEARFTGGIGSEHWLKKGFKLAEEDIRK